MSKLRKIQEIAAENKGLNSSAASYLLWYIDSLQTQLAHLMSIPTDAKPTDRYVKENFPNWIGHHRQMVDENQETIADYKKWFEIALSNKDPVVLKGND